MYYWVHQVFQEKGQSMIDINKKRAENKARLLGVAVADGKNPVPYTAADATNPEVCWEIISLCTRKELIERKGKGGSTYKAEGKNLMFPDLTEVVTVGEKAVANKNAKAKSIIRTNIQTMDEMYAIRNSMNRHAVDDVDDAYIEYFTSVVDVLDTYAQTVVADMITADPDFLARVNKARGCK